MIPEQKVSAEPAWPTSRNLDRYAALLGIDIPRVLEHGGSWIEVGPGVDASPMMSFIDRPDLSLHCIGPHLRKLPASIAFTVGTIPEHREFLLQNRGKSKLVTDVYASVSYSADPLLSLIYCTLLLEPVGTFATFTELFRFGELQTWNLITQFFRTEVGSTITFETIPVLGDATQQYSTGVRIRCSGPKACDTSFAELTQRAHAVVGMPKESALLWEAADASARICRVDYRVEN